MSFYTNPNQPINAINPGKFDATPIYAYDSSITGWRGMSVDDFGASVSGNLTVNLEQMEGQLSGIQNTLNSGIIIQQRQSTGVNGNAIGTGNGSIISGNSNRLAFSVQNLTTGVLFLKLGAGASATSFSQLLKADSAVLAGNGGVYIDDFGIWTGVVSVSGDSPSYVYWEMTK